MRQSLKNTMSPLVVLLMLVCVRSFAAEPGGFRGTITDAATGAQLSNARVRLVYLWAQRVVDSVWTTGEGHYVFFPVADADGKTFIVVADRADYFQQPSEQLAVVPGDTIECNLALTAKSPTRSESQPKLDCPNRVLTVKQAGHDRVYRLGAVPVDVRRAEIYRGDGSLVGVSPICSDQIEIVIPRCEGMGFLALRSTAGNTIVCRLVSN